MREQKSIGGYEYVVFDDAFRCWQGYRLSKVSDAPLQCINSSGRWVALPFQFNNRQDVVDILISQGVDFDSGTEQTLTDEEFTPSFRNLVRQIIIVD